MSEISAELIKELRAKTSAGVLDCKKALTETKGDLNAAVDLLRKSGAAKAEKKTGRITAEGRVAIAANAKLAALVEVNSETDFVAKNETFQAFVDQIAQHILKVTPQNLDALLASSFEGATLKDVVQSQVAKTGENLSIRRFVLMQAAAGEKIGSYLHMGNKIGVLVQAKGPEDKLTDSVLRDVAMHIAASNPGYLKSSDVPADVIAREKEIYKEQLKETKKPENVLEKILEGKIARFFDEVCLVSQVFVKDPSGKQTVSQYLQSIHPEIEIVSFTRYQVGEGIQKKEEDFAAEVAKTLKG